MSKLRLTVACGDYDVVRLLKDGTPTSATPLAAKNSDRR
jgi:hypothetical protein